MRRNGVLLSREESDRRRQVRAEVGRRLLEQYGADVPPMRDRLADLVRKIEQSASDDGHERGRRVSS